MMKITGTILSGLLLLLWHAQRCIPQPFPAEAKATLSDVVAFSTQWMVALPAQLKSARLVMTL